MSIPKIIHYCWFGGKHKPESVKKCIDSWRRYCPDYEIKEWNESNIDLSMNIYTLQAYEAKAWGFVPDYLRLWIVYQYGGIYLDTDVQVIKSLDSLLEYKAFAGFEDNEHVALGLGFGAEKGCEFLRLHMEQYDQLKFQLEDGSLNKTPSPQYTTQLLSRYGLKENDKLIQTVCGVVIFPPEYFCPKSFETGFTKITKNTFSIHQFDGSWCSDDQLEYKNKRWNKAKRERRDYWIHIPNRFCKRILGEELYTKVKQMLKG